MVQRRTTGRVKALDDRPSSEGVKEPTKVYQRDILDKMLLHGGEENCNSKQLSLVEGRSESHWL